MSAYRLLPAFDAEVLIIGINPNALLPDAALERLFAQAGRDKGPIPARGTPVVSEEERPVYDIFLMDMRTEQPKPLTMDTLPEHAPVFVRVAVYD